MNKYIDITKQFEEDVILTYDERLLKSIMEEGRTYKRINGRVRQKFILKAGER